MPERTQPLDHGLHVPFIKDRLPDWTQHLAPAHIARLAQPLDPVQDFARNYPQLYAEASPTMRLALHNSQVASNTSTRVLATTLKDFKGLTEFAKPLLSEAMNKTFGQSPDVTKTQLFHLRAPNRAEQQPLLQVALRNFEADEPFDEVALQETSAIAPAGALEQELYDHRDTYPFGKTRYKIRDKLAIKPGEFASFCRQLDLGQQYQDHLSSVFDAPDTRAIVREQTIKATRDRLRLQAHIARMKSNLSQSAYATLLDVIDGKPEPQLDGQAVTYSQLKVLGSQLDELLIIGPVSRTPTTTLEDIAEVLLARPVWSLSVDSKARIIVCMPGDPQHPVKEYPSLAAFAKELAVRLRSRTYQGFVAGLLPQDESTRFFRRLRSQLKVQRWNPNPVYPGPPYNPDAFREGMYEEVWNDEVDLGLSESWIEEEVFGARYDSHLARMKSNARLLAIPTAEVDHQAWIERLEHFAEWGLSVLNAAAFFVPGLGEVMLAVTAVQLCYEVYQGVHSWKEGDAEEAWGHFKSVMENVAFMAVLGAVASKAPPIMSSRFVDGMSPITTPFGQPRLWYPDLAPYASSVALEGIEPNILGQYEVGGKTYIKIDGNAYEKTFDVTRNVWRIKHPSDPAAYQPILRHNQLGAWRHIHEKPLEWDRLTLLRRMGPQMEAFSDAQLQQLAEVSGVSDDALRQMHIDDQPPPPPLAEAIRTFRADRQVSGLIDRIRSGKPLGNVSSFITPMVVEMRGWPHEAVLEVFEGPEPRGNSHRFGSAAALESTRPTIKITRAQVSAGKLPERVLAQFDDAQTVQLLGSRSTQEGADPAQMFRERMADQALGSKPMLVDSVLAGQQTVDADIQRLQRDFPTLTTEAARQVLDFSSEQELARLRSTGKITSRQARQIRVHVQQGALNRALCGLRLQSRASAASDRLALHNVQRLPGWSADWRVEMRSGSTNGPLLDSVGNSQATSRYHLVRHADFFRAYDAQGRPLNNIPAQGRNFFESLLEVLPPQARRGLPGDSAEDLQNQLAHYAGSHREEMAQTLGQRLIGRPGPSLRRPSGRLGYLASGRGVGLPDAGLVSRVRELYPNLSDTQASQFVRSRLSNGETSQQLFNLLNSRQREFEVLKGTLNAWIEAGTDRLNRRLLAERIVSNWRMGIYRGLEPAFDLDLRGAPALPDWTADFTHVRNLRLNIRQLAGESGDALLAKFTGVKKLDIGVAVEQMATLAETLPTLRAITELRLECPAPGFTPEVSRALEGMTQLRALSMQGQMADMDFSTLTNLQSLCLSGELTQWPAGVLDLAQLHTLDLQSARIQSLPDALFTGHETLWRGLQLNWGALEPQNFLKAYDYIHDNPAHLVDEPQVVDRYCRSRLRDLLPEDFTFADDVLGHLKGQGVSGRALLQHVEELHQRRLALNQALDTWTNTPVRVDGQEMLVGQRRVLAGRIRECARNALRHQYAGQEALAGPSWAQAVRTDDLLDMTGYGQLGDLPMLGDTVFPHIRRLNLRGGGVPAARVSDFVRGFPQLTALELGSNRLTEIPQALESLGQLTELDLSFNELTITQSTQARLNRMGRLRMLNLAYNRVGTLNVTALTDLQSLSLSHSNVSNWPEGVLSLPRLRTLNLDHSAITDVPEQALTGHDQLLARTSLQGCRLSPQGLEGVRSYADRTTGANPLGIPRTQLALGRTGGDPQFYPPEAWELPDLVLPLHLEPGAGQLPQTSAARLQRLDPQLGDAEAVARIEAWLAQGVSAVEIENQLVQWQQQQTQLIRLFNDWMVTPATRARRAWVTAQDRRRAADQLLESWRAGLREVPQAEIIVDFNGLIIGDLPAMPVTFNHVVELNLSGVGLSIESDAFLRAFPRLRSLTLDHNGLGRLPDAVANCQDLTHLNARHNDFRANGPLQSQLRALPRLQGLNLSQNRLFEFDLAGLDQLQTLDLGSNNLDEWPAGVLQAPALTTLDLTNNHISTIPHDALQPEHEDLMAGTDLSDNMLEEEEFIRLQFYLDRTGNGLGFTDDEIDRVLMGFGPEESSEGSDEAIHPDHETAQAQKERWFAGVAADSEKHLMWDTLRTADDTGDFSYILSQLQHTADFQSDRLGLTRRVWRVVEAAYGDEALRERLLGLARALRSRATCGDGRILLFNELETEVYEFEALKSIEPEHQGRELLKLSRGLFRLAQVEEFAKERIARNPAIDPAEVRLAFRIGLAQRLELPGQPKGMLYRGMSGVTQADLDSAYSTIRAQEKTPVFVEQLIQRTYWIEYLKKKYAAEFVTLQQQFQAEYALLEDKYPDMNPDYERELTELTRTNTSRQQTLLTTLSNREISDPDVAS